MGQWVQTSGLSRFVSSRSDSRVRRSGEAEEFGGRGWGGDGGGQGRWDGRGEQGCDGDCVTCRGCEFLDLRKLLQIGSICLIVFKHVLLNP